MATANGASGTSAALELFSEQEITHFNQYATDVDTLTRTVDKIVLRTSDDAVKVHEMLTDVKRIQLHIEKIRHDQVDPLNNQVKAINNTWRPKADKLGQLEAILKRKLLAFQQAERERIAREQAMARQKQEDAQRREREALAKAESAKNSRTRTKALEAAQAATTDLMEARLEEPMDAPTGIRTDLGTSSTRMRWTFKVNDPLAVPRQFLMVDEKAIRRAVLAGERDIPGVSIFEEELLATSVC